MATVVKLGPEDHGRTLTLEEFLGGEYREGFHYEIIDGRLHVSPAPNFPESFLDIWIYQALARYSAAHPDVINLVHPRARVFIPGRVEVTAPEPDVAVYADVPLDRLEELSWQDLSPLLVVEVVSADDPAKDLVRNNALYLQVPSIREYWIVDGRQGYANLVLIIHRRHGRRWRTTQVRAGGRYTTRLLPGFDLLVDPRL